jgi:TolB protein
MVLAVVLIFFLLRTLGPSLRQLETDSAPGVTDLRSTPPADAPDPTATAAVRAVADAITTTATVTATPAATEPIATGTIRATAPLSPTATEAATAAPQLVAVPLALYDDPAGQFRIALPADWQPTISADLIRFSATDETPVQFFIKRLEQVDAADSARTLVTEYVDRNVLGKEASLQNVRVLEERGYSLNAWAGYEQVLRATHLGTPVAVRLVAVRGDDAGFILGSSVAAAQEAMLSPVISGIIDSFQITPNEVVARAPAPTATPAATASPTPPPTATNTPTPSATRERLAYVGGGFQANGADSAENATEPISDTAAVTTATTVNVAAPPPTGRIAYAVWNPNKDRMDTYVYNIANGIAWPKLDDRRQPDFRFDGEMVFNGEGGGLDNLHRMKITGEGLQIISEYAEDSRPHWSPDGKQVVFDSTSVGDRRHRIYVQNIYEPDDERYTRDVRPMMYQAWELFGRYPIFLADGRIAYSGCNVWENGGKCGIYVTNPQAAQPTAVTGWPQDFPTDNLGTRILFMSDRGGSGADDNWDVYSVNADGSNLRQLTVHPARDGLATASPDGEYIAFLTDREGAWAVYIMRPDGSEQRKLFDLNGEYGRNEQDWRYDWKQERMSWGW